MPVFRYALEWWHPSQYELVVFKQGSVGPEESMALARLGQAGANLDVSVDDVSQGIPSRHALISPKEGEALPVVVLAHSKDLDARLISVWRGPLDAGLLATTASSPARRQIAAALLKGVSAVWVLVEGGSPADNNKAAELLKSEFARVEAEWDLVGRTDDNLIESAIPLRVEFTLLRLSRYDPAEQFLITLLMSMIPDSDRNRDVPMAFPVFGRGRVLCGLVGDTMVASRIQEALVFLLGECSCEIKDQNPGMDLVTDTDWIRALETAGARGGQPQVWELRGTSTELLPDGVGNPQQGGSQAMPRVVLSAAVPVEPTRAEAPPEGAALRPLWRNLVIVLAVMVTGVTAWSLIIKAKRHDSGG